MNNGFKLVATRAGATGTQVFVRSTQYLVRSNYFWVLGTQVLAQLLTYSLLTYSPSSNNHMKARQLGRIRSAEGDVHSGSRDGNVGTRRQLQGGRSFESGQLC